MLARPITSELHQSVAHWYVVAKLRQTTADTKYARTRTYVNENDSQHLTYPQAASLASDTSESRLQGIPDYIQNSVVW